MNLYRISNCLSLYQLNELYKLYELNELHLSPPISISLYRVSMNSINSISSMNSVRLFANADVGVLA